MKTRKFLWAVLPMMATALALTACGGDDATDTKPVPVSPTDPTDKTEKTEKSIPYTVTVKGDPETTRATVNADGKTMNFADDDELYISDGADIHGVLTLQSGAGSDAATFSGTLYYEASTPPNNSTSLTATLVSSNDQVAQKSDGKVTGFSYPTSGNVCSTLSEAVSKYSQLTGTGNYGSGEIVLSQSTAFLKFTVTLEDGTTGGASVPVEVTSDGSTTIGTGTVSASGTTQFVDIQALFYVPVAGGTVITKAASMCVANVGDDDESITYGASTNKKLTGGNVYTVSKTKDFVRLWANGPVWRSKNVGATSVTDKGGYYCWGGLVDVTNVTLGWNSNCPFWKSGSATGSRTDFSNIDLKFSRYVPTASTEYWGGDGNPDNLTTLLPEDDVATQTLGSPWRMPTIDEFDNSTGLLAKTTKLGTTVNGALGVIYTGKSDYNKKAIFLPTAGDRVSTGNGTGYGAQETYGIYWSSSLKTDQPYCAQDILSSQTNSASSITYQLRNYGRNVRAVHD